MQLRLNQISSKQAHQNNRKQVSAINKCFPCDPVTEWRKGYEYITKPKNTDRQKQTVKQGSFFVTDKTIQNFSQNNWYAYNEQDRDKCSGESFDVGMFVNKHSDFSDQIRVCEQISVRDTQY